MGNGSSQQQRRLGYIHIGASVAPIAIVLAMVIYFSYPPIVLLGAVPPVAIMLFFGYKRLSGTYEESTIEERRTNANKAANSALMILLGVISADGFFNFIPGEGKPVVYLAVGGVSLLMLYLYYDIIG